MSAIDSLTESSDSDDTMGSYPEKERDPSSIDFSFLKTGIKFRDIFRNLGSLYFFHFTGKSSKEGVLITHGGYFKFTKNNYSRDGKTHWYTCAHKKSHGCSARAIIKREEFTGEDGQLYVSNTLLEIATAEVFILYKMTRFPKIKMIILRFMPSSMCRTRPPSWPTMSW